MKIEWNPTQNHTKGRKGKKIIAIVNHITAGLMPGCLYWLTNPNAKVSAHYLITKKGRIINLVKDEDTAWHAGAVNKPKWSLYDGSNPNYYTLGIEHEGLAGDIATPAQWQATVWLHRQLVKKHGIPVERDNIIGHLHIDSVNRPNCPGSMIPFDKLLYEVGRDEQMGAADWKKKIIEESLINRLISVSHEPDETAPKWFVLAVANNILKEMRR